jgi:ribosomal-protein-alanine N-acetyltransferase
MPSAKRERQFIAAVHESRALHRGLVSPPHTRALYRAYLARAQQPSGAGHFVCTASGELAGVVNLNEIVRGSFRSAYLGYYAFVPHEGQGNMGEGLRLVVARAFGKYRLHRVEANIQPGNSRSIQLVKHLGFRLEGFSPRYLKISGRWRDHERWALTVEDWRIRRRR